jgi:hypothetical protein
MVRLGMGHARTALTWYLLMLAGMILANWALWFSVTGQWAAVAGWAVVVVAAGAVVDAQWRRHETRHTGQS